MVFRFFPLFQTLRRAAILGVALCGVVAGRAWGAEDAPTLVTADRMAYDQNAGIVTASGHVEVAQADQVLHADQVVYDQKKNIVRAVGHVAVMQPSGDVLFADQAELTSDLKQGFVDQLGVLFADNSRLAARDAQRYEGRYLVADHGVYSACDVCREKPERAPLWQIRATRITHDNVAKDVIYRDAVVEMGGVPILYSPYFSHPDPTVKRRQGFLAPSGGFNQYVGSFARIPYYFDIAPETDATFSPTFSTKDKAQLGGELRHRFANGSMIFNGSFTHTDLKDEFGVDQGQHWRGHLFGNLLFNLDDTWRTGADVAFTSDKSYLRRYNISSRDELTNRAFIEGFQGRDYAVSNLYYFQDLRPGAQIAQPVVTPDFRFNALGEPGKTLGGRWEFGGGLLATTRDRSTDRTLQGPDTRRLSLDGGWERQLVSSTGFLTNLSALTRLDGYWASNVPDASQPAGTAFNRITRLRPFAQTDAMLRYPVGRHGDGYQQIMEPIALLSIAPRVASNKLLPNEDSQSIEFDETNLFSPNRFNGIDRLEGGTRAAYGLRHSLIGDNGARIEMMAGQVYRLRAEQDFPESSGLKNRLSDYVGRIVFSPAAWFDSSYRLRVDPRDLGNIQRQELNASGGVNAFRPFVNYLLVKQTEDPLTGLFGTVEEGTLGVTSVFAKYWVLSGAFKRAFAPNPGPRLASIGVSYRDECFEFGLTGERNYTNRADLSGGTSVMVHFFLKNIGGVHTDSLSGNSFRQ